MSKHTVNITPEGRITFVYDDALSSLLECGTSQVTRASHVEPTGDGRGIWWRADLSPSNGPQLGPFPSRAAALAAEIEWLESNLQREAVRP
jgi:hypothetical protein